jgi:hypothetical protein
VWTRDYGSHGTVELVTPPGTPADWPIELPNAHDGTKHVVVDMWTRQEGRSDLSLELELERQSGRWATRALDQHVL